MIGEEKRHAKLPTAAGTVTADYFLIAGCVYVTGAWHEAEVDGRRVEQFDGSDTMADHGAGLRRQIEQREDVAADLRAQRSDPTFGLVHGEAWA